MYIKLSFTEECDRYDSGPYRVTFPAGTTSATLNININDDDIYEDFESFNIVIDSQLPNRVNRGFPSTATIFIIDDELRKWLTYFVAMVYVHDYCL